ncbi:MAG: UbiD family decarboxylase domain-containing protein [Candidatus Dasytiphilus stammeri]
MRNLLLQADDVQIVKMPLSPELEVSQYLKKQYSNLTNYPITIFKEILCKSNIPHVDNLLKRTIILKGLDMTEDNYLPEFYRRIKKILSSYQHHINNNKFQRIKNEFLLSSFSLLDLPFLKYQPKDAGRYLTSFVFCIVDSNHCSNLGFYRGEIKNENTLAIFIDPRTDAYRILVNHLQNQPQVYISLFNGGPIATYISAASKIPDIIDSYLFANALAKDEIKLFQEKPYPAVPITSEIVLYGQISGKKIPEGPFGEFKGYYSDKTYSYEVKIDKIYTRQNPYFFGLFCGKESGLNLMQFQNETFMYHHLITNNIPVKKVIYPLDYFSEFGTIIETEIPTTKVLKTAMQYDTRSKIFFVTRNANTLFSDMAIFKLSVFKDSYVKKGVKIGNRIGILIDNRNGYKWAEY